MILPIEVNLESSDGEIAAIKDLLSDAKVKPKRVWVEDVKVGVGVRRYFCVRLTERDYKKVSEWLKK